MVLVDTYLNKTKWEMNICHAICAFIPDLSPSCDHFGKGTSIDIRAITMSI
jgi:hypothetical protein